MAALYEAHRAELFGFLIRMTRDREAAEELLQDAFIRLIRDARAGRMPAGPAVLYRVAANAAISRARHGAAGPGSCRVSSIVEPATRRRILPPGCRAARALAVPPTPRRRCCSPWRASTEIAA
jgi:DNA-directed RNA polymerase specialized sigma24 family protein